MTNLIDFRVTDLVDQVLAVQYNRVIDSAIRGELSNSETITGNKTLVDADYPLQVYDGNGALDITLPAVGSANHPFYIVNVETATNVILTVKNAGGTTIGVVGPSSAGVFGSSGTAWYLMASEVNTHAAASKTTPVDADEVKLLDSAASYGVKRLTWANIKATLKTFFNLTDITTFTPTIIGTTAAGVGTYTTQSGNYWEVGGLVFVQIEINWTAHTGTGNMRIAGLPFTSALTGARSPLITGWSGITLLAVGNKLLAEVLENTNYVSLTEIGSGGSSLLPIDTSGFLRVSGFYPKA